MNVFTKKPLASLMALALIAAAFTGSIVMATTQAQSLTCPLNEDFSGSWLPAGWIQEEAGEWIQWSSDYAGGTPPEADLCWGYIYGDYAYLDSKPIDTTSAISLTLEFKSFIDDYCCSDGLDDADCDYGGDCGSYDCKVYTRANGSDSWTDVTPWSNPIYGSVGPDTHSIDISSDIGSATQVRFEFDGYYYAIYDWYVDDVKICSDAVSTSPYTPYNPSPVNHAAGVSLNADLSWMGGDPDAGDTVTYDVYFGNSAAPPLKETIGPYPATQSSLTYDPGTLSDNTKYYWQIVATDNHAASTVGPVWDFTTGQPGATVAWDCPLGGYPLIAPNPGAGRPDLTVLADCTDITVSAGAELWGIYYLVEIGPDAGTWLWYIPGFATSTLTQLEPGKLYWVVVSAPCTLTIPQ